jgi:hypothetical protein
MRKLGARELLMKALFDADDTRKSVELEKTLAHIARMSGQSQLLTYSKTESKEDREDRLYATRLLGQLSLSALDELSRPKLTPKRARKRGAAFRHRANEIYKAHFRRVIGRVIEELKAWATNSTTYLSNDDRARVCEWLNIPIVGSVGIWPDDDVLLNPTTRREAWPNEVIKSKPPLAWFDEFSTFDWGRTEEALRRVRERDKDIVKPFQLKCGCWNVCTCGGSLI